MVLAAALAGSGAGMAMGASATWVGNPGTEGDWFTGANWDTGVVPGSGALVYINNGGTAAFGPGGTSMASTVYLGYAAGQSGTLSLTGGQLQAYEFNVGYTGSGVVTQSGGTLAHGGDVRIGYAAGSTGRYELSEGTLSGNGSRTLSVGYMGTGVFAQSGGLNSQGAMVLGASGTESVGTYLLSGGNLSTGTEYLGPFGLGTFAQTGGTHTVAGSIYVYNGGYRLAGGALSNSSGVTVYPDAIFTQTGGVANVSSVTLNGTGRYTLRGGSLTATYGAGGAGAFDLTGPAHLTYGGMVDLTSGRLSNVGQAVVTGQAKSILLVPSGFDPATRFGSFATDGIVHQAGTPLTIPAGYVVGMSRTFNDPVTVVGIANGSATFAGGLTVAGGKVDVSGVTVTAGAASGISDGTLSINDSFTIESGGTFTQTGGTSNLRGATYIAPGGQYVMSGGAVSSSGPGFVNEGVMDFGGGDGATWRASGIVDLSKGTLLNESNVTLLMEGNSVLTVPAGFDPAARFKSFSPSIVHIAGTPLNVPAYQQVRGGGSFDDPVVIGGTLTWGDAPLMLLGGMNVTGGGVVSLLTGRVTVPDLTSSGMSGTSKVTGGGLDIGTATSDGAFVHTGGAATYSDTVTIGNGGAGVSSYTMQGGALSVTGTAGLRVGVSSAGSFAQTGGSVSATNGNSFYVGYGGAGTYTQSGGTSTFGLAYLGYQAGSSGTFTYTNGEFRPAGLYVGYGGSGSFVQDVPSFTTLSTQNLTLGQSAGSSGTYELNGGTLTVSGAISIGSSGSGLMVQRGGAFKADGSVTFGVTSTGVGAYRLEGGQLTATSATVGLVGTGSFVQTGGTATFTSGMTVGVAAGSSGRYELGGGVLSTGSGVRIGSRNVLTGSTFGVGTFVQTGGTFAVGRMLDVLNGTYAMSGGTLSATGGIRNAGTVDFGGGTSTVTAGGMIDLTHGTWLNTQNVNLTTNAGSLLVVPAGQSGGAAAWFKTLSAGGLTHVAGSPLVIPAGASYADWQGDIDDRVDVSGSLSSPGTLGTDEGLRLNGGATVSGAGNLVASWITANGSDSGVSGGYMSAGTLTVAASGPGGATFTQTGGTFAGTVTRIGFEAGSDGTYVQSGGTAALGSSWTVGVSGVGRYVLSAGAASGTLTLGSQAGSTGTLELSGGTLSGGAANVGVAGTGLLRQTGGAASFTSLTIGPGGRYEWSGGELSVSGSITNRGVFDMAGSAGSLTLNGVTDLGAGQVLNTDQVTATGGAQSLLIVPAGFDPAARFKSFTTAGLVHEAGTTLSLPAGQTVKGTGTIDDFVDCSGTIAGGVTFNGGLHVNAGGSVTVTPPGANSVNVNDAASGMSGGTLSASLAVGTTGTGVFTQTDGTYSSRGLSVGSLPGGSGTYRLSGGTLGPSSPSPVASFTRTIGSYGTGSFVQTGGVHQGRGSLLIGYHAGSSGTYELSGGMLSVGGAPAYREHIGYNGTGVFRQSGGTHTTSGGWLYVGSRVGGGVGTYELSGGELSVGNEGIGYAYANSLDGPTPDGGSGTFRQTGGTHTVAGTLYVGSGLLDISGGSLTAGSLDMVLPSAALAFEVNAGPDDLYELVVRQDATIDGTLHLRVTEAMAGSIGPYDEFVLLSSTDAIAGAFDNVTSGSRLMTDDGRGSFLVSYGADSEFGSARLVISDFVAVPEPGPAGMLLTAWAAATMGVRRRRRI